MFPSIQKLHHALIMTGNRAENLASVKAYISEQGIAVSGNPDVLVFEGEQVLMADVERIIASLLSRKLGEHRFCVISFDRLAVDVQNTLLKSLEEPQIGTHFFILVPTLDKIIPTILSRCQILAGSAVQAETRLDAEAFLKMTVSERFELVESFTKAKKDEDNVSKAEISAFLDALEKLVWERGIRDESLFADIRHSREYVAIRGASHRIILDFIGIVCPILKK
jgi:DNA polymerase III delta prime subunit